MEQELNTMMINLLQFNPYMRWSASECLNLQIFNSVRDLDLEQKSDEKIEVEIDHEGAYDYSRGISSKYDLKDYKQILLNEVYKIKGQDSLITQSTAIYSFH